MKRRLLIFSSLITLLLSCFSFPIWAEETVQDSSTLHTLSDGVFLDSYFYENYDLLPYIQSTGSEYINTGYNASSNLRLELKFSDFVYEPNHTYLFGGRPSYGQSMLGSYIIYDSESDIFDITFSSGDQRFRTNFLNYTIYDFVFDRNNIYLNNNLIYTFINPTNFSGVNIYLFALNENGENKYKGIFKLYSFSIFDYSVNDGEGAFVRYYYPAKAKTSGAIGLYDAVNKTFIVSGSNVQFINPTNEYVENFQISSFLTNSLTWIGQIFDAIIQIPIIIIFMAIGLAGAMFRWGRRIVHF